MPPKSASPAVKYMDGNNQDNVVQYREELYISMYTQPYTDPLETESTAFFGTLWPQCAHSASRKAVDLSYLFPASVFYNLHSNI